MSKFNNATSGLKAIWEKLGGVISAIKELTLSMASSSSVLQFKRDAIDTYVSEDTITPANSIAFPVKIMENLGGGGFPTVFATHWSPFDFNVVFTSNVTLTLSGHPSITDSSQISYIKKIKSDNTSEVFMNGVNDITITYAANVITIHGAGTPFASGDFYEVGLNLYTKGYDISLDTWKVITQNPLWNRYTEVENVVTGVDIGAVADTWLDQGTEIDSRGYKKIGIWVDYTDNNSTGGQIQILPKHTFGGTDEFKMEISASYQKTLVPDDKIVYPFGVETFLYVQIQTKATVLGATEGTVNIYVTKEW